MWGSRRAEPLEEGCSFSKVIERRCATDEQGELRCHALTKIYKHCPGRPTEEIIEHESGSSTQQHDRHALAEPRLPEGWGAERRGGGLADFRGLHEDFRGMAAELDNVFRMFGFGEFGMGGRRFEEQPPRSHVPRQEHPARSFPGVRVDEI
ncbi:MAG: hypothetical protein SGPRY_001140 [Prymnesium sp.]